MNNQIKKCTGICGEEKALDNFKNGSNQCRKCLNLKRKIYVKKNKESIAKKRKIEYQKNKDNFKNKKQRDLFKKCTGIFSCGQEKPLNNFNDTNYSRCKECTSIYVKEYRKKNKNNPEFKKREAKSSKTYANKIKGTLKEKEIKAKVRLSTNKRNKEKRKNDPSFRLKQNLSNNINKMLRRLGSSKNGKSIIDYLGYSKIQLKEHIESLFEPWMTWNNWGNYDPKVWDDNDQSTWTWHIDHIIPHSTLPYTSLEDDNFKKCWALSNLRPLSAKQNVIDGALKIRHKEAA